MPHEFRQTNQTGVHEICPGDQPAEWISPTPVSPWRRCDFCGSIHPADLLRFIRDGRLLSSYPSATVDALPRRFHFVFDNPDARPVVAATSERRQPGRSWRTLWWWSWRLRAKAHAGGFPTDGIRSVLVLRYLQLSGTFCTMHQTEPWLTEADRHAIEAFTGVCIHSIGGGYVRWHFVKQKGPNGHAKAD